MGVWVALASWRVLQGMVAPGEQVSLTLKREFSEETMNSLELPEDEVKTIAKKVDATFQKGKEVRPVS